MSRDEKSSYYDAGGIEVVDIIKAKLTPEEYRGYLKGNAIKYLCREAFKEDAERDREKAANYAAWLRDESNCGVNPKYGVAYRLNEGTVEVVPETPRKGWLPTLMLAAALLASMFVWDDTLAQEPGPHEMSQQFIKYGKMPDGSYRHLETLTYTEARSNNTPDPSDDHIVEAHRTSAFEIPGPGAWFSPDAELGPLDPDNSSVSFRVDGQCPHPGLPNMVCGFRGDFTQLGMDDQGRYYATACDERTPNNACNFVGEDFFFGVTTEDIDALGPPPTSEFHVEHVAPHCYVYNCPPHRGYWGFSTTPQVEVLGAVVEVRHIHPETGPGPVVEVDEAPRHEYDISEGWANGGSPVWTHVGSWCEVVPGINPHGGDFQYRIRVTAIGPDGGASVQTGLWKDFFVADCYWAPLPKNPADLNEDGEVNLLDLGLFRALFGSD